MGNEEREGRGGKEGEGDTHIIRAPIYTYAAHPIQDNTQPHVLSLNLAHARCAQVSASFCGRLRASSRSKLEDPAAHQASAPASNLEKHATTLNKHKKNPFCCPLMLQTIVRGRNRRCVCGSAETPRTSAVIPSVPYAAIRRNLHASACRLAAAYRCIREGILRIAAYSCRLGL